MNPRLVRLLVLGAPIVLLAACASEPAAPAAPAVPAPVPAPAPAPAVVIPTPPVAATPPAPRRNGRLTVREAQQALADKGYDPGVIDGHWGPRSVEALRQFQRAEGLMATGRLDSVSLEALAR
ncbi:peptidoglycan-binding domain-containing protein [Ottowia testudinis]|uniref:Peptidoglycan-binding protein n=1 Tax=Ottowia testudinis TaxID=2816950 RepID=A0A975H3P6_9BURK|nr:peptidoglycan-binding domain-containing protein [Ottowia testudinis]QTD45466.1 peptidoglycan-binding protein [Ottowia testudinis]